MNYSDILREIYEIVSAKENIGQFATYIPELSKVDPEKFGIQQQVKNMAQTII